MAQPKPAAQELLDKIRSLPPERMAQVEDFVDFLRARDEELSLTRVAARLSKDALTRVGDNSV